MIRYFRLLLLAPFAAASIAGCASRQDDPGLVETTQSASSDMIGLPRDRPGAVMVDQGDETVPTPYGGAGSARTCPTVARDIARLTAVIGPDEEYESETEEEDEERSLWDRSRDLMSAEKAEDAALDAYHSAIVGLNPARPVIRFLGRAGEIESAARAQHRMALKRRAYLRGLYDGLACERADLIAMFEEYGLRTASQQEDASVGEEIGE